MSSDVYATTVLGTPPIPTWQAFRTDPDGTRWWAAGVNAAGHADHWSRDVDDGLRFTSRSRAVRAVALRDGGVMKGSP